MLTVRLFGTFEIARAQEALYEIPGGKTQELLCYLLLHRRQAHPREALAALLWPECETAKSRKYLRQVLWQLQLALASAFRDRSAQPLSIDTDSIHLDGDGVLEIDVEVFENAYRRAHAARPGRMDSATVAALQEAVQLYRGDLLQGCYQPWCLVERDRLHTCYLSMLDTLIGHCREHRDHQKAIDYGERVLRVDRAHERGHQQLMSAYYRSGDRTAALRQYERCKAALQAELGVQPSRQTRELYEQMRADEPEAAAEPPDAGSVDPPLDVVDRLERLLEYLTEVETKIKEELRVVRQAAQLPDRRPVPLRAHHVRRRSRSRVGEQTS